MRSSRQSRAAAPPARGPRSLRRPRGCAAPIHGNGRHHRAAARLRSAGVGRAPLWARPDIPERRVWAASRAPAAPSSGGRLRRRNARIHAANSRSPYEPLPCARGCVTMPAVILSSRPISDGTRSGSFISWWTAPRCGWLPRFAPGEPHMRGLFRRAWRLGDDAAWPDQDRPLQRHGVPRSYALWSWFLRFFNASHCIAGETRTLAH